MSTLPPEIPAVEAAPAAVFLNRELSWLAFNERVLEQAEDARTPLLERLRFLSIFHTNLDEFFMIRVSGLLQQVNAGVDALSDDGQTPRTQLGQLRERVRGLLGRAHHVLGAELRPRLAEEGVQIVRYASLDAETRHRWDAWYDRAVHPVLTPLGTGPTQPFPFISNLSLNIGLTVRSGTEERFSRVKIPGMLPRLVVIEGEAASRRPPLRLVPIEEIVVANLWKLFPGCELDPAVVFRVTRDADIEIKEDEADDLLQALEDELRRRRFGSAVRLEVQAGTSDKLRRFLRKGLGLAEEDVFEVDGPLDLPGLEALTRLDLPQHRYPAFVPVWPKGVSTTDLFADIRGGDVLLHHPFDSFAPVVSFIENAARDPNVYAIKQTLYRTSGDSPIIEALEEAAERGKQVAAIVELKARFDEENNIGWARRLEEAGVHVIYGVPGLKTHCKIALVVRAEAGQLRRYAHIATGNYNPNTARVYTDLGLFTADPDLTDDVADLFNRLTGFAKPHGYRRLLVAPRFMKTELLNLIRRETDNAREGRPARIIAKCNAVTEKEIIRALYDASRAGVEVDLLVRGICCLVPGIPGLSERIRVRSVVGRFLEHSRVYWFANDGAPKVYFGSADWMDRNLNGRLEVLAPVRNPALASWLRDVMLERYLRDTAFTRLMLPDGSYERVAHRPELAGAFDVHQAFMHDVAP